MGGTASFAITRSGRGNEGNCVQIGCDFLYMGIFILLLLPISSGRAFAQSYAWDDYGYCPWYPYDGTGPFASATSAYNACIASYYALGGYLIVFQWKENTRA